MKIFSSQFLKGLYFKKWIEGKLFGPKTKQEQLLNLLQHDNKNHFAYANNTQNDFRITVEYLGKFELQGEQKLGSESGECF